MLNNTVVPDESSHSKDKSQTNSQEPPLTRPEVEKQNCEINEIGSLDPENFQFLHFTLE